jgi:hypothetical protein
MGSRFSARRGMRALALTTAMSMAVLGTSAGSAHAAPLTNAQLAQQGAQWLANQIKANGGLLQNFGKPDPVDTAYAVIGMRATGVDKPASDQAMTALEANIGTALQTGGHASPAALAEYIIAAHADGLDPKHFGGTAARNNLVNRLLLTQRAKGPDQGLFGAAEPTFDGAYRQGLALIALRMAGYSGPRGTEGLTWLRKQECANGLWEAYRPNPKVPCVPANATTFAGPDTNSTATAVEAFAAWFRGGVSNPSTIVNSLKAIQSSDGGFPFVAAPGQASDPNSTALVIQTLVALHTAPSSTAFTKGTNTPYTALASYQLDCTSSDFGAFRFPGSPGANVFATVQAVPALAGKKLPVASSKQSLIVALNPC